MKKMKIQIFLLFVGALLLCTSTFAQSSRSKAIDFEDEVIEGVNKKPLDSLSHIGSAGDSEDRPHLYRKRSGFRTETKRTLQEQRWVQ